MGRKPNQLILEYFERGPKLEDASNRYQHTCKSCGEKFPKGRIDSLTTHLLKKCPAVALGDRRRALFRIHDLPDIPDNMAPPASAPPGQAPQANTVDLPFAPSKQGMSALETLAEVSRQRLDLPGNRLPDSPRPKTPPAQPPTSSQPGSDGAHGALIDDFLIHDDRPDTSGAAAFSQGLDMSGAPALPSIYQFNRPLQHSPTSSPQLTNMPLGSSGSIAQMVPSLVMAASAANELMPMANGLTMDQDLGLANNFQQPRWGNVPPNSNLDPLLQDHLKEQNMAKEEAVNKSLSHPRPIAMNPNGQTHFTTDFSMNQKPAKPKVRGRFSDTRRKEVQEVRKRGACIRCRMLKKPCSGDNPCNTCQNVESARLWKQPCIRTRIAEEFNLYSAGLHAVLAFHAISQAKGQIRLDQAPGRIEATHYPDSSIFATFFPLKCLTQANQGSEIDPILIASLAPPQLEIIDNDDDISGKVDLYVKKIGPSFFEAEDSHFMKTTLTTAFGIDSSNQDGLLAKVLELWNLTRILTSRNLDWIIYSNPSSAPTMTPSNLTPDDVEADTRTSVAPENNPSSYNLIKMQLMGATEKRAACLSRIVMNDLERRLLQRQQASPFETFLVAVILLACVERMCWLFRTWEEEQQQQHILAPPASPGPPGPESRAAPPPTASSSEEPSTDETLASALQSASSLPPPTTASSLSHTQQQQDPPRNKKWPFDKPPASFSQQGERFSDILLMLLKMRSVPPRPVARNTDGVLVMWAPEVDDKVREWYDGIGVTHEGLAERSAARFEGVDPREWELKFAGKIIGGGG